MVTAVVLEKHSHKLQKLSPSFSVSQKLSPSFIVVVVVVMVIIIKRDYEGTVGMLCGHTLVL